MSTTLEILKQLQDAAEREAQGDEFAHMELLSGVQRLQNAVSSPAEKMLRMRFGMYHNVCVRLAQEYGVLQALAASDARMTALRLSETTGAGELLIVRIMRVVTQIGVADEVGPGEYQANETTRFAVTRGIIGDVKYYADIAMKISSNMGPLAEKGLLETIDPHTYTFGMPMFPYMKTHRPYGQAFEDFMTGRRAMKWAKWFDIFPARERIAASGSGSHPETDVLLVDVAGGQGFWTQQFREAMISGGGNVSGRLIVQDQPHVLRKLEGIETMAYDFFTPQPVISARFYYFKQILHNWNDKKGAKILSRTAAAMGKGWSTLLINDFVLPEEKVGLRAAYLDIAMMVLLGGIPGGYERTKAQWRKLVESAGLKIVNIWYADAVNEGCEAVIECEKM